MLGNGVFDKNRNGKMTEKVCVIFDEVDGLSAGDRGGAGQIVQFVKATKVPIMCVCNDRNDNKVRNLANYC